MLQILSDIIETPAEEKLNLTITVRSGLCHRRTHGGGVVWDLTVRSSTTMVAGAALCSAVARANRRSFLFILMLQSLGCGGRGGRNTHHGQDWHTYRHSQLMGT